MADMPKEMNDRYEEDALKHCDFLVNEIFRPAFVMAFKHGAKHMFDELKGQKEDSDDISGHAAERGRR